MTDSLNWLRKNRTTLITLAIFIVLLGFAAQGMPFSDWVITLLRGLSIGALTFLVASGFSIILGLMDVLNLAHGELFMIGAYVGWTAYVRPDTVIDIITPLALLAAAFVLMPVWRNLAGRLRLPGSLRNAWPWAGLLAGAALLIAVLVRYPIGFWSLEVQAQTPITYSLQLDTGQLSMPSPALFERITPVVALAGIVLGGCLLAFAVGGFAERKSMSAKLKGRVLRQPIVLSVALVAIGLAVFALNDTLTAFMFDISTTWRFLIAIVVATGTGAILGGLIETTLIRPLYERPVYQLMLTLGLGFILVELVRAVWGRPEFQMPRPDLFDGSGEGCPAVNISTWLQHHCSTILVLDARVRTYNEIFIIAVGIVVLIAVWLLLQRTRLGMIIRAGVQDSEMVEALGINVRRVFTMVFALGVALATLGGVLAGPSLGLSNDLGMRVLLLALIALAIGGLTSFPGAAAGSVLVALLQQFIIKYGQIGIKLPFFAEPFKPSPPVVPASTVLLMVIILLVMPQGLFGRKE
jgi:branched-chain amino acid transport system permease protein